MDSVILIGILGSVASVVSLLLAKPDLKSRLLHAAYTLLIVVMVSSAVIYNSTILDRLKEAQSATQQLKQKLQIIEARGKEAKKLLVPSAYSYTYDIFKNPALTFS